MAKLSKHIQNKKKDREKKRAKKLKNRRVSAIGKHKLDTISALKNEINNDLEISKNVRSQTKLTKHNRNIKIPINVDHRTEQTQPKNKYDGEVSMYLSTSEKNYTLMEATNLAEKPSGSFDLVKKALGATIDANRVTDVEKSKRPKKNNRWKKLKAELQEKKKKREDLKKKIDNVSYNQGHSSHAIGDLTDGCAASDFKTLIPNEAKTISQRQEKKREWRRQMKRLQKLKLKWVKEGQTDIEALVSEWRHKKRDSLNSDGGNTKGSRLLCTTEDSTHPDAVSKKQTNDAVTGIKDHKPSEKICAGEKMQAIKKINLPKSNSDEVHSDNNNDISQSEPDYKVNSAFERNIAQLKKVGEMNKQSMSGTSEVTNKALQRLRVAQFRIINESLYTLKSDEARKLFENDPSAFQIYHDGYRSQVCKWPINPLDRIIEGIKRTAPQGAIIVDCGCGDAKLAKILKPLGYTVHSFDLVSNNEHVVACNMKDLPLKDETIDIAVMCLSLMGTDMGQFILEANRILKTRGMLKVAEVESRIPSAEAFTNTLKCYGFKLYSQNTSHNVFAFFDFTKNKSVPKAAENNMDKPLWLKPCLYKKR